MNIFRQIAHLSIILDCMFQNLIDQHQAQKLVEEAHHQAEEFLSKVCMTKFLVRIFFS